MSEAFRQLPQMQSLIESPAGLALIETFSRPEVIDGLRACLQNVRDRLRSGELERPPEFHDGAFFAKVAQMIERRRRNHMRPAINATGIVIHTNLGRAPLAPEAIEAVRAAAAGYSNLEMDLDTGKRSSRQDHVETLVCELTGAEAALVVNNCAASVLACLSCFAAGREVIASRGELIEIGGSFRLPDVIAHSGARLREVGATNKTRLKDYEDAVGEDTAVLLKSHTSNFRIVGFTSAPLRSELAGLAKRNGLVLMEDLGSGVLIDLAAYGLPDEPVVRDILAAGVDLVTFSGDKLLGGPQAGIIAGRKDLVGRLKSHPLMRTIRIDKLSLAALEATLRLYRPPHDPVESIPVLRMLAESAEIVKARAEKLLSLVETDAGLEMEMIESVAYAGGGSLPDQDLASFAVAVSAPTISADELAGRLRSGDPAVVGRIKDGRLRLDMRTVADDELADLSKALCRALAS